MTALLAAAWAGVVLALFAAHRPAVGRVADLAAPAPVGPRRVVLSPRARRWAGAATASGVALVVLPAAAPLVGGLAWLLPVLRARRRHAAATDELWRSLPEVVDLVAVGIGAGLTVPQTVAAVAVRHHGSLAPELRRVTAEVAAGRRFADALDDAADRLGPVPRPLLDALLASERHGAPLGEALARLGGDVRAERRRRREEAARRVPVKLLFPVVACVLPAFALLTVAPLLAGTLGSLRR